MVHVRRDEDGRIVGADGEDQEHRTDAAAESILLHFSSPGPPPPSRPSSARGSTGPESLV